MLTRIVRDPLLHFLMAGLGLFGIYEWVRADPEDRSDSRRIVVDRDALLSFIQYRSRAFEPEIFERKLEGFSDAELARVIDDYVREEVLYREAVALGLDREDYVIRRRIVQKLEFVTRGFAELGASPDEAELRGFFADHRGDYFVEPRVTFTHVFFDAERRGRTEARRLAAAKLAELNRASVPFEGAPGHGDRFPYHVNYVERTLDFVDGHFGSEMARAVWDLDAVGGSWQGPFESPYGTHLVMLTKKQPGRLPALDEVRGRVAEDARRAAVRRGVEAAVRDLVDTYEVEVVYRPPRRSDAPRGPAP